MLTADGSVYYQPSFGRSRSPQFGNAPGDGPIRPVAASSRTGHERLLELNTARYATVAATPRAPIAAPARMAPIHLANPKLVLVATTSASSLPNFVVLFFRLCKSPPPIRLKLACLQSSSFSAQRHLAAVPARCTDLGVLRFRS